MRRRKPAGIATQPAFLSEIAAQDRARRLLQYAVIGRLVKLQTPAGAIEFPRDSGPGIGVETAREEFLFVTPWPALPELQDYSEEFCPACLAECEICSGTGKSLCVFTGCGGAGIRQIGVGGCECRGKNADCSICAGSGNVPIEAQCPSCKGTGQAMCGPCRGLGRRPTGIGADGATCAGCRGSLRGGAWRQQDLHSLLVGKLGNYVVAGPVVKLAVRLPGSGRGQAPLRLLEFSPADGMMLLLPIDEGSNPPAYFWRQRGSVHED